MDVNRERNRVAALLGIGAGIAVLGLFTPWVSLKVMLGSESTSLTQSGISTDDGKIILLLAALLSLLAMPFVSGKIRRVLAVGIVALLCATVITLVGFADIADIRNRAHASGTVSAKVGFGLYITTAGGIVALAGAAMALRGRRTLGEAAAPEDSGDAVASPPPPSAP